MASVLDNNGDGNRIRYDWGYELVYESTTIAMTQAASLVGKVAFDIRGMTGKKNIFVANPDVTAIDFEIWISYQYDERDKATILAHSDVNRSYRVLASTNLTQNTSHLWSETHAGAWLYVLAKQSSAVSSFNINIAASMN